MTHNDKKGEEHGLELPIPPIHPSKNKESSLRPELLSIEVLAFVGPAGTGKSQRASQVARQYDVSFVIDDGLVVSNGRIMAGKSAKSENNMLRAIRRAIFEYPDHRDEVMNFLADQAPCKIMIIATSKGMLTKIVDKLKLPSPARIIEITDVASPEEIDNALRERREKKQHVVPVARAQIQRNFAGKLVSQLKDLFKSKDKEDSRTVVNPPFSFDGRLTIEKEAILDMVRHLAATGTYVQKVHEISLETDGDALDIDVKLDIELRGRNVLFIARLLQKKISVGLSFFTGMEVKNINISVNEVIV